MYTVEFLNELLNNLPEYILCKDSEFQFTYANKQFCDINHKTIEEIIGKTDYDLFDEQLANKYREDDAEVLRTGRMKCIVEPNRVKGGRTNFVRVVKIPIVDENGQNQGIQIAFTDVTEDYLHPGESFRKQQLLQFEHNINNCKTLEELYDYCINSLSRSDSFRATYSSFFTFSITEPESSTQYLVLRDTNFPKSKPSGNKIAYKFNRESEELSLTEWVAVSNNSLRLNKLDDRVATNEEIRKIDDRLRHRGQIEDSDPNSAFLAVPISLSRDTPRSTILGVLRLTRKDEPFTSEQEQLLNFLSTELIAPRLSELKYREFTDKLVEHTEAVKKIASHGDPLIGGLHSTVKATMKQLFLDGDSTSGKAIWLARCRGDGDFFQYCMKDAVGVKFNSSFESREMSLEGTVTGIAVTNDDKRYVCVTDFEGNRLAEVPVADPPLQCAIACCIRMRNHVVGVIGVASTAFDIDQVHHGMLLELVAAEIGQALVQIQMRPTFTQAAFRHDHLAPFTHLAEKFGSESSALEGNELAEARSAVAFCVQLAQAYCRSYPNDPETFEPISNPCNVLKQALLAKEWAEHCTNGDIIDVDIDKAMFCFSDSDIILAILFNLLTNAREHGSINDGRGKIQVRADLRDEMLEFSVSDMGSHVARAHIDEFLEYQVADALLGNIIPIDERKRGLGLQTVAFLVRHWKLGVVTGTIDFQYTNERLKTGSSFTIRLPVRLTI